MHSSSLIYTSMIIICLFFYSLMFCCTDVCLYTLLCLSHPISDMVSDFMVSPQRACSINHFHGWNWQYRICSNGIWERQWWQWGAANYAGASKSAGWIWSIKQDKGTGVPSEDDRTLYWNSYSCYSVPFLTNFLTGFDGYKSDWYSGSSSPSARTNWQEDWISKSQRRCK